MIDSGAIGLYSGCGQVEQPGLVKEAVAPFGVIVNPFGLPLSFGTFSQDASQSSPDPAVHRLECIAFAVAEVVKPSPQYRIDSRNDARKTLAVGSAGSCSELFAHFNFALLAWPFLSAFEVITQELKPTRLGGVDDLGFLRMQLELCSLHPVAYQR